MPEAFDEQARRHGVDVRSFNLGMPGAHGHEVDYLLERHVLSHPGLSYVFLEFPGFEYQTPEIHERTFRQVYWHDARRTLDSMRTTLRGPLSPGLRWAELQDHLIHFVLRSIGRWSDERAGAYPTNARGYREWDESRGPEDRRMAHGGGALYSPQAVANDEVLRRQQRQLEGLDIEVYYVLPPGGSSFEVLDQLEKRGAVKHVIRMNNPEVHPEVFDHEAFGTQYLLNEGARRYSARLGDEFAAAVLGADSLDVPVISMNAGG